ncbi:MAG: DUF4914 family protein [Anaerolineae bacterium]|nr:DUF4914 family protein [Anaerolineae bacterium]
MDWSAYNPPAEVAEILAACPALTIASTTDELLAMSCCPPNINGWGYFEVAYDVPGRGRIVEATVARVRNGIAVNYTDTYMRRRDPDCMVIGDDLPTDKETYQQRFGTPFAPVREATFAWLKTQELILFGFRAGQGDMGVDALVLAPKNTAFFALALALLQGITPYHELSQGFHPKAVIYVAPPFRHTHFDGKQVVVHNRRPDYHEMFSYNLYPGPSAKKGVYGILIALGEQRGWVAAHCSAVQVVTPYDNVVTIMHEGASGGGKSEMLEQVHREADGRLLLGVNLITGEKRHLEIPRTCELHPLVDDIALCCSLPDANNGKLHIMDAEDGWFVRVNHIDHYGTDVVLERLTAQPPEPLVFLNIDAVPGSRALIWEHIEDAPGKRCPNPRVIIPRHIYPGVINGPVPVDIRSLGVRCPPCTREKPTYGILGLFHILPPALAWLWRLAVPRGHDSPSIVDSVGMESEGVGSYWPFATGRRVPQANLLLEQFVRNPRTRYILTPNQHIGAWRVGFMPQWIAREYLARRGSAKYRPDQLKPARCSLLGYIPLQLNVEGRATPTRLLQVETQPEVGEEAYDKGAEMLQQFFRRCLREYLSPELSSLGRQIIQCCLDGGTVEDYRAFIAGE